MTIGMNGWDTHSDNFRTLRVELLPVLDRVLAALVTDLADRGLLHETVVYCTGEFGRTPRVNGNGGMDHWSRSMSSFLAGGSVVPGAVIGTTDVLGTAPTDDENVAAA